MLLLTYEPSLLVLRRIVWWAMHVPPDHASIAAHQHINAVMQNSLPRYRTYFFCCLFFILLTCPVLQQLKDRNGSR